jgi:hypothetical protein
VVRATRLDLFIESGADFSTTVVDYEPDVAVAAEDVTPGSYLYLYGVPTVVYDVTTTADRTTVRFGQGLHNDPSFTLYRLDRVMTAAPVTVLEAVAAFTYYPTDPQVNPLDDGGQRVEIPATVAADGLSVTLALDADETAGMDGWAGAYSWDMYVRTADGWRRSREGTLTIVKGDAR